MALTAAQLPTLKTAIQADPVLNALPNNSDANLEIAEAFNLVNTPDFWVWRTSVSENEFTRTTSIDGTTWSWPVYIARSQGERDAWARMFQGGISPVNPSLANVRQGIADIFSGGTGAAQRTHLLAIARRLAKRGEKLFATGTGTSAVPGTMTFEGNITASDVDSARNL